jgi:hypothetical protein
VALVIPTELASRHNDPVHIAFDRTSTAFVRSPRNVHGLAATGLQDMKSLAIAASDLQH